MAVILAIGTTKATAQHTFAELRKEHIPIENDDTRSVVIGDVDGDGVQDLVLANYKQQNSLYRGNRNGTFSTTSAKLPPEADATLSMALFDADGDGDLDLLYGNSGPNRLLFNDGTGSFIDGSATHLPSVDEYTYSIAVGDFDSDGDIDILCGNNGPRPINFGRVRLYLNDGRGKFTDSSSSHLPQATLQVSDVKVGDVDSDGDLDLVVGVWNLRPQLYLNDGRGHFVDATWDRIPSPFPFTSSIVLADLDGDRDLDIVGGNSKQNFLYLNDGTGRYRSVTATHMPTGNKRTADVIACDVDADGDLDLLLANPGGQDDLYENNGSAVFSNVTASHLPRGNRHSSAMIHADIDSDGDLDVIVANSNAQSRLLLNDGAGKFANASSTPLPDEDKPTSVAVGDLNGDGFPDLVFGHQNRLYLNNGSGSFTDFTTRMPVTARGTTSIALGDIDNDRDLDIVIGHESQNQLYVNDGQAAFRSMTNTHLPSQLEPTRALVLGDVDADGDLDLICANADSAFTYAPNRLYLNDGTGKFAESAPQQMPIDFDATMALAIGDLDGDGDLDLLFGNTSPVIGSSGQNRVYLNDGFGTFQDVTLTHMPQSADRTYAVAIGDVDGDGDLDIVTTNVGGFFFIPPRNKLLLNNGTGRFSDVSAAQLPSDPRNAYSVALGDLDGDGDLDLIFGNSTNFVSGNENRVYLNDGSGFFTHAPGYLAPDRNATVAIALADVDVDGDLDVITTAPNRIYSNLRHQLHSPLLLRPGHEMRLEAYARGAAAPLVFALPFISAARAHLPAPPFGTFGLDPTQSIGLPAFVIQQPSGMGSTTIVVPMIPSLVGARVFTQALLIAHPHYSTLTSVVADIIVR